MRPVDRPVQPMAGLLPALSALVVFGAAIPGAVRICDDVWIFEELVSFPFLAEWSSPLQLKFVWRPLTESVRQAWAAVFGYGPSEMRALSVLLHALNTALLASALHRLRRPSWITVGVVAAWAVHPTHASVVGWSAEHYSLLAVTGLLLAARAALSDLATAPRLAVFAVGLACSVLAKEAALLGGLALAILLAARAWQRSGSLADAGKAFAAHATIAVGVTTAFYLTHLSVTGEDMLAGRSALTHRLIALLQGTRWLLGPYASHASITHLFDPDDTAATASGAALLGALVGLGGVGLWKRRGDLWWIGLAGVLFAVNFAAGASGIAFLHVFADRYFYIPSALAFCALGVGLDQLADRGERPARGVQLVLAAWMLLQAPQAYLAAREYSPGAEGEAAFWRREFVVEGGFDAPRSFYAAQWLGGVQAREEYPLPLRVESLDYARFALAVYPKLRPELGRFQFQDQSELSRRLAVDAFRVYREVYRLPADTPERESWLRTSWASWHWAIDQHLAVTPPARRTRDTWCLVADALEARGEAVSAEAAAGCPAPTDSAVDADAKRP